MEKTNIFKCKPPEVHFTIRDRVPYNKLLTNLACSNRTVEYWPSVVFVRTSLRSVRTATTSGQYFPVQPSRSVSKRLILTNSNTRWRSVQNWRRSRPSSLLLISLSYMHYIVSVIEKVKCQGLKHLLAVCRRVIPSVTLVTLKVPFFPRNAHNSILA